MMTPGSDGDSDNTENKEIKSADSTGAPTKGDKPTRKVSKTLMEGAKPQGSDQAAVRKIARTKLEIPRPVTEIASDESQSVSAPEAVPPAKPAKTIVELLRPDLTEGASASIAEQQDQSSHTRPAPRKVKKTMLEQSLPQVSDLNKSAEMAESSKLDTTIKISTPEHGSMRYVAKTMLDHQVLSSALERSAEKKKIRAAELALERSNEPVKEFHQVDSRKMATPCSFTWSESGGKDRVRACSHCRTQVYDFTGMELDEAEALIFKQESIKKAKLFKRADGKFMTKNCPVQATRKRILFLLCIFGVLVMLSAVAVLSMMPPQPHQPEPAIVDQSTATQNSESKKTTPLQGNGTFHYRAGEPEDVQSDSNPRTVSGTPAPTLSTTTSTTTTQTTTSSDGEYEWDTSGAN